MHWSRHVGRRIYGAFCHAAAILAARLWVLRRNASLKRVPEAGATLLFTWYPRVWVERFGEWQDMYYGSMRDALVARGVHVTWTMRRIRQDHVSSAIYLLPTTTAGSTLG